MKLVDISGTEREHMKAKINKLETKRTIISETYITGTSMSLRRFTSLEYSKG